MKIINKTFFELIFKNYYMNAINVLYQFKIIEFGN